MTKFNEFTKEKTGKTWRFWHKCAFCFVVDMGDRWFVKDFKLRGKLITNNKFDVEKEVETLLNK